MAPGYRNQTFEVCLLRVVLNQAAVRKPLNNRSYNTGRSHSNPAFQRTGMSEISERTADFYVSRTFDGIIQSPAPNDNPNLSLNPFLDLTLNPSPDKMSTLGGLLILVLTM